MSGKNIIIRFRRALIILGYLVLTVGTYIAAYYLRFEFVVPPEEIDLMIKSLPVLIVVKFSIYAYFRLFAGFWGYASIEDLWQIFKATITATAVFIFVALFVFYGRGIPRSVFVLDWLLSMAAISAARFFRRGCREIFRPVASRPGVKALIVGAGAAGMMVYRELKNSRKYDIVGFIDDSVSKKGVHIFGKKVFGGKDAISKVVTGYGIESIIIAIPSARGEEIRKIVAACQFPEVKMLIVPGFQKILSGELEVKVKEVQPEDLLGRESVQIDEQDVGRQIKGKVVLITGAAGSIGSEITRQIIEFAPSGIVVVDHNENDLYFLEREIRDKHPAIRFAAITADAGEVSILKSTFSKYRPNIVFHASAYKHVPLMEENPASAVKNNVIASRNLIYASEHYGVEEFVLISSDKAVNPTNVMGATKRIAEMIVQAKAAKSRTKFLAVRFGNVLGSKGSVVPLFKKQIEEDRRITVTHPDTKRYFMSIREAVQLVLQASVIGEGGEILVLDMGEQINIVDFAKNLIMLSGFEPEKEVKIDYIGLRPGEKLYEETLHNSEKDRSTRHEKIFVARPDEFDIKALMKQVKSLERFSSLMDSRKIVKKIQEMVPNFTPSSKYDVSDV